MRVHILSIMIMVCASTMYAQDLDYYTEQAIANSPLVHDNINQAKAAQLEIDRLKAQYTKSQISINAAYALSPIVDHTSGSSTVDPNPDGSATDYFGYDLAASNGGLYQGLININQPLFNGSRFQTIAEQSLIGRQINENSIELARHDLEKVVTDQYILCLRDYAQGQYLNDLITILADQYQLLTKMTEAGVAKQSDLSLLVIERDAQEAALSLARSTYRRDLMALRVICGINDTSYQILAPIDLELQDNVFRSQFVERYRLDSLNLVAAQKVFELKYMPSVGAYANAGLNAVYLPTIPNRFGFSVGLNFSLNLSDGKQRKISQERTQVLLQSTTNYKESFYTQNGVRKSSILQELDALETRLALVKKQLAEYQRLLSLYARELANGQMSIINYLTVMKAMVATERDVIFMNTDKQLLINQYNYWNW